MANIAGGVEDSRVRSAQLGIFWSLALALLAALGSLLVAASPAMAAPSDRADYGTPETNGRVETIIQVGNRIYIGGNFTSVNGQPRSRLAAIDASTGNLTGWSPNVNNRVMKLAASGGRIYAGGYFTRANGATRNHVAAFDADGSGALITGWNPQANNTVFSLAAANGRVYMGGFFSRVDGANRSRLAAVDADTGNLNPNWKPAADANVRVILPQGDNRIYLGGNFKKISGKHRLSVAAVNPFSGNVQSWDPDPCEPAFDLAAADGRVYAALGGTPSGCGTEGRASAYSASTGNRLWTKSSDGDFQAVEEVGGKVYFGGHFREIPWASDPNAGDPKRRIRFAALNGATGRLDNNWTPEADRGVWAMEWDSQRNRLYAGGEFTEINGRNQQGLVRFLNN